MPKCGHCGVGWESVKRHHCQKTLKIERISRVKVASRKMDVSEEGVRQKALYQAWGRAIDLVDSHNKRCRQCHKRRHPLDLALKTGTLASVDPYTPCSKSIQLWKEEQMAIKKYFECYD